MTAHAQAQAHAPAQDWEKRNGELWASLDELPEQEFLDRMDRLTAELPPDHPVGLFERAAAADSLGHTDRAVPLYREALRGELPGERRRRAVIQLASSLRGLGHPEESVALLTEERAAGSDHLDDAVSAVLALGLAEIGRAREAVGIAVGALSPHLPRYQRSMANYARLLVESESESESEPESKAGSEPESKAGSEPEGRPEA